MEKDDIKLTAKDRFDIVVEAGIGSIPAIGGALQTLYFGAQNEKRFKRIEQFYKDMNEDLEKIKNQIPPLDNVVNQDEFLGILEDINAEVEKAKSQAKITYFKNLYKHTLLSSSVQNFDTQSFFLETLISLTNLELELLRFFHSTPDDYRHDVTIPGVSGDLIQGSLNRLSDYGLLSSMLHNISIGGPNNGVNNLYKITPLGIQFVLFVLVEHSYQ